MSVDLQTCAKEANVAKSTVVLPTLPNMQACLRGLRPAVASGACASACIEESQVEVLKFSLSQAGMVIKFDHRSIAFNIEAASHWLQSFHILWTFYSMQR